MIIIECCCFRIDLTFSKHDQIFVSSFPSKTTEELNTDDVAVLHRQPRQITLPALPALTLGGPNGTDPLDLVDAAVDKIKSGPPPLPQLPKLHSLPGH